MSEARAEFLTGVRVLELGDGVAGASAASILWGLGAEVTAVVDPASAHRRGRPRVPSGEVSLLAHSLDRGKRLVRSAHAAALTELVTAADVVVCDRVHGLSGALAGLDGSGSLDAYLELASSCAAWVSISAFGLNGARGGDAGTELSIAAASGMLTAVRDPSTGQPLKLAGQQSLLNTGQAAALAACHALDRASRGEPAHLDLSAVEATLAMGPVLEVGGLLLDTASVGGAKRYGAPASFYPCTDGLVRISAMEDHQWEGVVAALGSPEWAARFATVEARIADPDEVDRNIAAWARTRTKLDAETLLQSHGVPATAVASPAEILHSPQLAHRGAFQQLSVGEAIDATVVGVPFRVMAHGAERRRRSLRGLRVLEAGRVLAVPLSGSLLGALGAEVTKLEDLRRLDMYRRRGPYIEAQAGQERSAYFALMNHSKASVAIDVDAERARFEQIVDAVDVVIENLGPKRAGALGVAAATALARRPDLLAVSSSGFGQDGPHAEYRAYAYNLQAACALGYLTRTATGETAEIDIAWADLITAYAIATTIAAWAVGPAGNSGAGLDLAMADLVVSHFNEHLAAASLDAGSDETVDRANDLAPYAPHGVYPTSDGWIAICVDGAEQRAALQAVLGGPIDSDDALAVATSTREAQELAVAARAGGCVAEPVATVAALVDDAHLAARGFLHEVVHPVWGARRLVGLPWQPFGGPPLPLGPPPLLGQEHGGASR